MTNFTNELEREIEKLTAKFKGTKSSFLIGVGIWVFLIGLILSLMIGVIVSIVTFIPFLAVTLLLGAIVRIFRFILSPFKKN